MANTAKATATKTTKKAENTIAKNTQKVATAAKNVNEQVKETAEEFVTDVVNGGKKINTMATQAVKETAEKIDFTDSVNKIKATAKSVNNEIKATATEVMEDVKENTQEVRTAAAKLAKNVNTQLKATATEVIADAKENTKELRAAATKLVKKVSKDLKENAADMIADAKENTKELRATATKLAKEAMESINVTERLADLKKAVKNTNDYALETAEEIIEGVTVNGEKWQQVTEKAVKSGLKLAAKNQEIMFTTLEAVKVQLGGSANRFKKLIGKK